MGSLGAGPGSRISTWPSLLLPSPVSMAASRRVPHHAFPATFLIQSPEHWMDSDQVRHSPPSIVVPATGPALNTCPKPWPPASPAPGTGKAPCLSDQTGLLNCPEFLSMTRTDLINTHLLPNELLIVSHLMPSRGVEDWVPWAYN